MSGICFSVYPEIIIYTINLGIASFDNRSKYICYTQIKNKKG